MLVTFPVPQSGKSTHPTAPHRLIAGSGCQHNLSEEPSVSTRSVHDVTPSSTYPVLHVGTQDVPLTRVSVQLPTAPLRGARDASHALSMRVHPPPGRVSSVPPSNLAYHAFAESRENIHENP
jgi:hypothetical protein